MELYVNPQITDFRQDVNGDIKMLKIGQKKEDAWANIAEQSGKKLDNNKTATINVSTYTEPVEVLPTSGKDGMKKATITLSNIPGGVSNLYYWRVDGTLAGAYTESPTPSAGDPVYVVVAIQSNTYLEKGSIKAVDLEYDPPKISYHNTNYYRDSTHDITLS